MNIKKIKCIILDFDGTMYSNGAWLYEIEHFIGGFLDKNNILSECKTQEEKQTYLNKRYPQYHIMQQIYAYLHDSGIDDSEFRKYNQNNICEIRSTETTFINHEIISKIAKHYNLYMISDSAVPYLEFYLDYAGIDKNNFIKILSNEYTRGDYTKIPMMKKVLQETGLKPDEIIMIGDSEKSDIVPAKLMGFQTAHIEHVSDTEKLLNKLIRFKTSNSGM